MPDLAFHVEGVEAARFATSPQLDFRLQILNADPDEEILSIILRVQIQIEVARRQYSAKAQSWLLDLFGEPSTWDRTLRNLLWTHAQAVSPPFRGQTTLTLPVPTTFDFNAAATKYFHAFEDGEVPLCLMFSGTVFYAGGSGFQVAPISWDKESRFRMPVSVWREMMDRYYPNSAWLCLRRDIFEKLCRHKMSHGMAAWEEALDNLLLREELSRAEETVSK